jgi:hypothetical protein
MHSLSTLKCSQLPSKTILFPPHALAATTPAGMAAHLGSLSRVAMTIAGPQWAS